MIEYLGLFIFVILVIYLVFRAYIKIKYPFWSTQPVNHSYNLFPTKGRIINELPPLNKYVNLVDIKTLNLDTIDDTTKTRICNFIPYANKTSIIPYLEGSNYSSYISIYKKPKMLFDIKKNNIQEPAMYIDEYISVITARILHITLKGIKTFPLYYVDNLCANKKDEIDIDNECEMIATHLYNVSRFQRKVVTFLFNSASVSSGSSVPLTTFVTLEYDISQFHFIPFPIGSVALIEITKKNISLFTHYIHQYNPFNCVILPELSNIQHLIKTDNLFIYGIIQNRELIAVYIFKKQHTAFVCVASSYIYGLMTNIFVSTVFVIGFHQALQQIHKRDKTINKIMINNISHNSCIIENERRMNIRNTCEYSSAFFLYNYGCDTYPPSECFFIY